MISRNALFGYDFDARYSKPIAYFSMEFAIDQPLKIYSGGLGFLAGSHMRSAFELKQNLIGIGMLWKYGYYDQTRGQEGTMKPEFVQKFYSFLEDTGITFQIPIHGAPVNIKAYLLKPGVFSSIPLFLLTTDLDSNDALSRSITHKLYDGNEATRVAQSMVLGIGGAKLLDVLGIENDIYHMNEGHALPLCFYLWDKFKSLAEVKKRVVFTTHTPEKAGNEEHSMGLLQDMGFFYDLPEKTVREQLQIQGDRLDYTLSALRMAKKANGVSKLHGEVARQMWGNYSGICDITSITNAQNKTYWKDDVVEKAYAANDSALFFNRKKELKKQLFTLVADQCGKLFRDDVFTIVWGRRFAGYKRADLMLRDFDRFLKLATNTKFPVQIIWAGKPYPEDTLAINIFNNIYWKTIGLPNCTVVTGYELHVSSLLKKGADVWLNNPRLFREASGTSGMTASMNGAVNLSIADGWIPEFARHGENSFLIPTADRTLSVDEQDTLESKALMDILENEILPTYYNSPEKWWQIVTTGAKDVYAAFESGRMADEYYTQMYNS